MKNIFTFSLHLCLNFDAGMTFGLTDKVLEKGKHNLITLDNCLIIGHFDMIAGLLLPTETSGWPAAVTLLFVSSSSKWCHSYELVDTEKIASLINRETETFFNRLLLYCFIFKDLESTYDMCYEANEWTLGQPFAQWPLKSSQKRTRCPKSSHLREKKNFLECLPSGIGL